jgi:hypothetical protein
MTETCNVDGDLLTGTVDFIKSGETVHYKEGKYHRLDGPAIHWTAIIGSSPFFAEWHIDGRQLEFQTLLFGIIEL